MTEDELRALLRTHGGWTLTTKTVRGKSYLHAVRRKPGDWRKQEDKHLCSTEDLESKTEADIVARLS